MNDSRKARTRDRWFLAWLSPKIDEYPVSSIADLDVIEEIRKDGLAEGWSHSTVDRCLRTVRAVLKKCVAWRYLESCPPIPMYGEEEGEPRFLTPEQFARLRQELPPHLDRAARFAVNTLLRMRSQCGLTWDRIDIKAKMGWVPRAQMKGRAGAFNFPLNEEALRVLRECRAANPTGLHVFQYEGKPIGDLNRGSFQKASERAGVPWLRWHDLRHTGASWAVQSGVTLPELMVLGNWKSYRMVLRYAHLAPSNAVEAARKVAQMSHSAKQKKRKSA